MFEIGGESDCASSFDLFRAAKHYCEQSVACDYLLVGIMQ